MNRYQFVGIIDPPDVLKIVNFTLHSDDLSITGDGRRNMLDISIDKGKIVVTLETENNFDNDLETLKNSLEYFVNNIIHTYNYFYGTYVNTRLVLGGNNKKKPYSFPPVNRVLSSKNTSIDLTTNEVIEMSLKDIQLARAINQAIDALKNPIDTGFYCYRALEAIRQTFLSVGSSDNDKTRVASWEDMSNALKVKVTYIKQIKNYASLTRHGGLKSITGPEVQEIINKTWEIIDRYLILVKNNRGPLGEKYPWLV